MTTTIPAPLLKERLKMAEASGFKPADLTRVYRLMRTARRLDDREILLKRQSKIYFQISGAGHEAIGVAVGSVLRPGYDSFYLYYRDRALALTLGITSEEMLLGSVGAAADPASGGRQMPSHFFDPARNIALVSSCTGTQYLQALGCADAVRYLHPGEDRIVLVSSGDGATSEGEFWESINQACLNRSPMMFLVEDNGYAISVPVDRQTPGGSISRLLAGFPDLFVVETDGNDFLATHRAVETAAAYIREGHGPALVHAHCTRPYSHSLSDDERFYKTKAEREAEAARDPLVTFPRFLIEEGVATSSEIAAIDKDVDAEILAATERVLSAPAPNAPLRHLYSEDVDPTSARFDSPAHSTGELRIMADLINNTLKEEMRLNPRIVVFGEDVADCSHESNLSEVKGKGGVFKLTAGLQTEFGSNRCFNTPIAEAAIVGRAIGMAATGLKPVAEIQFFDYIWPAMMQIRDELASYRWRANGRSKAPVVLRVPIGGYLTGGSVYHSQSGEVTFTHLPGLRVVYPSNAEDACGLLRTALRADDPVMFLEHKKLYREMYNRAPWPGPDFMIPLGKAKVVKQGASMTIVTFGALVQKSILAAVEVEKNSPSKSIEVIDLRSLAPYDWEAIKTSVMKTSRLLVAYEDTLSFGYGAEIAARAADELFTYLDAPVRRVAALDTWVGYHPQLEDATLPQTGDIEKAITQLLAW